VLAAVAVVAVVAVVLTPVAVGAGQWHHVPHVKFVMTKAPRPARFVASLFQGISTRNSGEWLVLLLSHGEGGRIVIITIAALQIIVAAVLAVVAMAAMAVSNAPSIKVAQAAMVG